MFRFRVSHFKGDRFPEKYEIPFVMGKTSSWDPVKFSYSEKPDYISILTDSIEIRIDKRSLDWKVLRRLSNDQIHPSTDPVYGMFKKGYTVFDNASAFDAPSRISRYSHWFYNSKSRNYTDIYLEHDLIADKYFIYGPDYKSLYKQLNELIGPEPLLPKKAYGFIQTQHLACNGTQSQLMEVVAKFRDKKIPLDIIILDFEWGDGCDGNTEVTWGSRLEWNKKYITPLSPKTMLEKLDSLHVDVMLIHHSAGNFKNRKAQGWTETVYDEDIWWSKYIEKLSLGVRGTWQDTRINDITDSYIYQRTQQYYGTSKRVLFLGSRKVMAYNPWDFRFSIIPAENMIGARRYPFHWTEDCSYSWNEMAFQLKAINNTWGPMSGYSYLASDVIGADWRIQARWSQFTALSAIARSHNSKPWSGNIDLNNFMNNIKILGRDTVKTKADVNDIEQNETAEISIRKYLHFRYRLLPYIYSYALENYLTGMPVTRPMLLSFPHDYMCSSDTWPYQYMLGENILIAPVYGDFKTMEIYLPKGFDWIDFESDYLYKDGGLITYNTENINKLPIFVKRGAIIPMRQQTNWIDTNMSDSLTIEVFPSDKLTAFTLYEDDGESTEYQSGQYGHTTYTCQVIDSEIKFVIGPLLGDFKGRPDRRTIEVKLHNVVNRPRTVTKNNSLIKGKNSEEDYWRYEESDKVVVVHTTVDTKNGVQYIIK